MTTSHYRCLGCREYRLRPEYRHVGLGGVCSSDCLADVRSRTHRAPPRPVTALTTAARAAVKRRDRHRCRFCGRTRDLHIHHINYLSQGVDHAPPNLITLCEDHHGVVHSDKRFWQPMCRAYIWLLYVEGRQRFLPEIARQYGVVA